MDVNKESSLECLFFPNKDGHKIFLRRLNFLLKKEYRIITTKK